MRGSAQTDLQLQVVGNKVGEVSMAAHRALELQGTGDGGATPTTCARLRTPCRPRAAARPAQPVQTAAVLKAAGERAASPAGRRLFLLFFHLLLNIHPAASPAASTDPFGCWLVLGRLRVLAQRGPVQGVLGTRRPSAAPDPRRRPCAACLVLCGLPFRRVDDAAARSVRGLPGVAARSPNVLGLFLLRHTEA